MGTMIKQTTGRCPGDGGLLFQYGFDCGFKFVGMAGCTQAYVDKERKNFQ
jgi:hypothetical protein